MGFVTVVAGVLLAWIIFFAIIIVAVGEEVDGVRFNTYLTFVGPGGQAEVPNSENPLEAESWEAMLRAVADYVQDSHFFGLKLKAIRIEELCEEPEE